MSEWEQQEEMTVGRGYKEPCRPDYEGMIKRQKQNHLVLSELYGAVHKAVFTMELNLNHMKLRDLLGTLHVQMLESDMAIDQMIAEQEKDKGA